MADIPRSASFDSTLALKRDPYGFISRECRRLGSDVFETRLLLKKTLCMTGAAAAQVFYDPERFVRAGAAPLRLRKTLFGRGGVQGLDDEAHRHRKHLLLSRLRPERVTRLADRVETEWIEASLRWSGAGQISLYRESQQLLTRAVCAWAGVPLDRSEIRLRTRQLTELFDFAGSVGLPHWLSRRARRSCQKWLASLIAQARRVRSEAAPETILHEIAFHRGPDGELLSPTIAAVELLNILRPTVAVSVYVVHVAHALHAFPGCRERIRDGDEVFAEAFLQEVRRFYPFFPAVIARVRSPFEWNGFVFPKGRRVLLDLYGINHDPRIWHAPEQFWPERFLQVQPGPFEFVPQGGGDPRVTHRCPGEPITLALMGVALEFLVSRLSYDLPPQSLQLDRTRLPAIPRSRFLMRNVRLLPRVVRSPGPRRVRISG